MKAKYISISMFIFLIVGISFVDQTQVRAEINLGDGICSDDEMAQNLCIKAWEYVIEVFPDSTGTWPFITADGMYKAFQYRAYAPAGCTSPTWSYSVTQWEVCPDSTNVDYIADSDPTGSSLIIKNCKVSGCGELSALCDGSHQLWKLNPTLVCGANASSLVFTIYTPIDSGLSCGNPTYTRTSDGCQGGLLRGPGCFNPGTIETTRVFDNGTTTVNYDICTGTPTNVQFEGLSTEKGKAWICTSNPLTTTGYDCSSRVNCGPDTSGCLIYGPDRICMVRTHTPVDNKKRTMILLQYFSRRYYRSI